MYSRKEKLLFHLSEYKIMVHLICSECERDYRIDEKSYQCVCGGAFELTEKNVSFPLKKIKGREPSIWRYREAIPVESDKNIVSFGEGLTPMVQMKLKDSEILAKLDFLFPTGSFKDRGSSVMISHVKSMGIRKVMDDSSGNGTKTVAFEIAEQLNWESPDNIICPCGNGGVYAGLFIGFSELLEKGIVKKIPKLLGVQSSACPPIYNAYREKIDFAREFTQTEKTIAEGVCLAKPPRGQMILRATRQSKGAFEIVNDDEVIRGLRLLSSQGIFVEPTSAIVVPALEKFNKSGTIGKKEKTVLILTGSGLKATDTLAMF